ncbi:uncharacterized protein LOC134267637 [Saccostrea cucullata]|uniref:uncharacterized protein LOC134267637 n=1 Tax=Saccostrea cuccullata TaxID=36930 RepID=UPI002ED6AD09
MRTNASGRQTHFVYIGDLITSMSKRESLNKLKVNVLRKLAEEHGINVTKKKKEEIIQDLLICQTSPSVLTPIVLQDSAGASLIVPSQDSLPPFNAVIYESPDHSYIPTISFTDIYNFIIERPTPCGSTVKNFKGLDRSVKHFEAGDVQDIRVSQINPSVIYVKATCQASMKKQQYQVFLCVSTSNTGKPHIQHGYCQCPIGLAQACSHIGALLFALSHAKPGETSGSCTSQPCKWIIPGRQVKPTRP